METKIFTIVGGVNGTGKSSFLGVRKEVRKDMGHILISSDCCPTTFTAQYIGNYLNQQCTFTLETALEDADASNTAKKAQAAGYQVRLYYVGLNTAQESLERIANRVRRGGHDIPQDDVLRRFDGRWESVAKVLPYCNEAEFYDNDNGFVKVGEYRNGELILIGEHRPSWILDLKSYLEQQ